MRIGESVWDELVDMAMVSHEDAYKQRIEEITSSGIPEPEAKAQAFKELFPLLCKSLRNKYLDTIKMLQKLKKDPIHQKILATKRKLQDEEEYGSEEAWEYAIKKRKYLLNSIIEDLSLESSEDEN